MLHNKSDIPLSLGLFADNPEKKSWSFGHVVLAVGFFCLLISALGVGGKFPLLMLLFSFGGISAGALILIFQNHYNPNSPSDFSGTWTRPLQSGKTQGILLSILITGFYIGIYWFPSYLNGLIRMMDPLSMALRGKAADEWTLYTSFYTLAVTLMGIRAILKYRSVPYHTWRTVSVMLFQILFGMLIPWLLTRCRQPEVYFHYFWPLDFRTLFPDSFSSLMQGTHFEKFILFWGILTALILVPLLTWLFGKRWYCSWVCGCGGLAETAGDPFRHLSDKSLKAWKAERWIVHGVLLFILVTTLLCWVSYLWGGNIFPGISKHLYAWYGFFIGQIFSGVIGVGFYPVFGSRLWCRFGCPQAAILGILQKYFSRFRISTNGGQCISCGNCSTYCEMGIDVKAYAQRGEDIVRASCVGCGICSTVCPRGVLKLENRKK